MQILLMRVLPVVLRLPSAISRCKSQEQTLAEQVTALSSMLSQVEKVKFETRKALLLDLDAYKRKVGSPWRQEPSARVTFMAIPRRFASRIVSPAWSRGRPQQGIAHISLCLSGAHSSLLETTGSFRRLTH